MLKLVSLAESKDASGFQEALHEAIAEKVSMVLESLREQVAADFFNSEALDEGSEESRQRRAKRFADKAKKDRRDEE